ncbi:CDP-alcohol phosphatidyltransferase family protein [Brachybacterium phenoliresistens]|uniref:Phosphatidylglycerophosphate synthase n=1 Tax=Brachybacterium phenoliresistens TaxID=396014 RepID=Z9JRQ4_9MICO|nr:CDP-alcohol phosphatidyltransferase family protein [Brachybacterium phenoliresistens]EWS80708.1 phosphatidylglycerophosphate synthase [Brachybacterium phenoliresistens]
MTTRTRPDWATLPNAITVVRLLLLVPVCRMLVVDGPDTLSVVLLLVWACTDWIDGLLARALDQRSRTGEILDPIADRIGLVGIVASLALAGLLPWTALVIVLVVDVAATALAGGAAMGGRLHVSPLGKLRTFILMTSVFLLAAAGAWAPSLIPGVLALLWAGVLLHVGAGLHYIVSARTGRRREGLSADRPDAGAPEPEGPPSSPGPGRAGR